MKKYFSLVMKSFGLFSLLIVLILLIWWLLQPTLPEDHIEIRDEYLISEDYRVVADSSILKLQEIMTDSRLPSLSVAVSQGRDILWACTFGYSDIKKEQYPVLDTRYRAGSVSKSMTGLVAARLCEVGLMDMDQSVYEYVPSFPQKQWNITLRQLSSHTGGIRHYSPPGKRGFWAEQISKHHYHSVDESLQLFKDDPLEYQPGHGFRYSTHGFSLLSAAMEKASGKDFISTMKEFLWTPYDMSNTRPDDFTVDDQGRAVPYTRIAGRLFVTEGPDPSYKWAGGGILSTPSDLVLMGGAFASGAIIDQVTEYDLFTPIPLEDGSNNPQNYAMGWRNQWDSQVVTTADSVLVRHHGGASPGGSSFLLIVPDGKVAAAAMSNYSLRNSGPLRSAIFRIAASFRIVAPEITDESNMKSEAVESN